MTEVQTTTETGRDRIRRLLLDPLAARGFRFPKGTPPEEQTKRLNDIAASMAYLSDESLRRLEQGMRAKGQGSAKCFWPDLATFDGYAEVCEPRPLSQMRALVRWFRSVAGTQALHANRLVAEYEFWTEKKRPPRSHIERQMIDRNAADYASKAERVRDRIRRGLSPFEGDGEWLEWFEQTEAMVRDLLVERDDEGGAE